MWVWLLNKVRERHFDSYHKNDYLKGWIHLLWQKEGTLIIIIMVITLGKQFTLGANVAYNNIPPIC